MTCLQNIHRLNNHGMVIFLCTVTSAVYRRKHQSKKKHFYLIVIPQTNALFYLKCGFSEYKEASYQYDSFLNTVCPSDTSTNFTSVTLLLKESILLLLIALRFQMRIIIFINFPKRFRRLKKSARPFDYLRTPV